MTNDTTIGQNVRRCRRMVTPDVTQADLAHHLGLSSNSVHKYEKDLGRGFKASHIPIIAAFLGCDIMDLYEGVEANNATD